MRWPEIGSIISDLSMHATSTVSRLRLPDAEHSTYLFPAYRLNSESREESISTLEKAVFSNAYSSPT
jgi:hypothetical protein